MAASKNTIRPTFSWSDIAQIVLGHRRELGIATLVAVLGTIAAVPVPLLIPLLVDEVLLNRPGAVIASLQWLFPDSWHGPVLFVLAILALTLMLRLLAQAFAVWQVREFTIISKHVIFRIRSELLRQLGRISMAEYETLGPGTVASHLVTDLDAVDDFVSQATSRFVVALLTILGTAAVLLAIHWPLALFILTVHPLVIWSSTKLGHRVKHLKAVENRAYQNFQENLNETLTGIHQIRASNREDFYIDKLVEDAAEVRRRSSAFTWKSDAANRLSFLVFIFGFDIFRAAGILVVAFAGVVWWMPALSIGQMLAVFAYLWFMMAPVQEMLNIQYAYQGAKAALQRINTMLDVAHEPQYPHNKDPFAGKETVGIQVRELRFAYGDGPDVLHELNLDIASGEKVALVGASGGGKTTLVQLILGLYTPAAGRIQIDGVDVRDIGLDRVRANVATVLQHPALFNDSVRMNLSLGRDIPDPQLWRALALAQLDDRIRALPGQLDTLIGRDGVRLSGGQRQRLAIARMILANPKVVILDEATSALDTRTEERVHRALAGFLHGRTTLIIAHRLSAVRQADRALVFEDGHIVEDGSHDELIREQGLYASLYGPKR